ncbi:hypothetical protein [Sphingobacterium sp. SGG-5]|uniref:hypothetical protein n=1 Tax=Sphingobacterium sp. SGG-5 TaxID=2710881 RepID=UPI0019D22CA3|nr:hypothetical protein [Sphingobacterium sp. SGG-5]
MKTIKLYPWRVITGLLLMVIVLGESSCKRSSPFDYFEEQPVYEDTGDDNDDNNNNGGDEGDDDDGPQTIEPGENLGDLGQVVFSYAGETVVYATVRLGDGSIWLQQNLGSFQVAGSTNDHLAHGDLFQWGRWDDGHQLIDRTNPTQPPLAVNSTNLTAPNPDNILATKTGNAVGSVYINKNTWWNMEEPVTATAATPEEVTATNGADPCKAIGEGWRLPTATEYTAIKDNTDGVLGSTITNSETAFNSILKLTVGAIRTGPAGFTGVGNRGMYWSSTAAPLTGGLTPHQSMAIDITVTTASVAPSRRYFGCCIRCLKK